MKKINFVKIATNLNNNGWEMMSIKHYHKMVNVVYVKNDSIISLWDDAYNHNSGINYVGPDCDPIDLTEMFCTDYGA